MALVSTRRLGDVEQLGFIGSTVDGALTVHAPLPAPATNRPAAAIPTPDFRFGDAAPDEGGARTQVRANIDAIRALRDLQITGGCPSPEQQERLARYIGWGRFPGVFVEEHPDWGDRGRELRALLTPEEFRAAQASTPNANYTPGYLIRAIYRMLARLGVHDTAWKGLQAFEPGCGAGDFIGYGPPAESGVRWTAVELEPIAAGIARRLYPSSSIRHCAFEHAVLPRNAFDLVVGNVPFGSYPVHDPVFNPRLYSIHNYFIVKSVALTRPGGLIALITSRYTLDQRDSAVRSHLAQHADLIAAVRLPDVAFRGRAVQRVTTDLLILQRRAGGDVAGPSWMETVNVETEDGPAVVNEYYARFPDMMAGTLRLSGKSQYREAELAVVLPPESTLDGELARITALLPEGRYEPTPGCRTVTFADAEAAAGLADGAFSLVRHQLRRWEGGRFVHHGFDREADVYRVSGLCGIRDAQRKVLRTQAEDAADADQDAAREELNRAYDAFVREYGPINLERRTRDDLGNEIIRRPNLDPFRSDPYGMNVAALEKYDAVEGTAEKAAIFSQRVVRRSVHPDHAETAEEALLLSLDRTGRVDLAEIAALWGRREADVVVALEGRIFCNPATQAWETDDEYLSGRVRRKLREAQAAAESDSRYKLNVQALEMVQPTEVGPSNIHMGVGATWVGRDIYLRFVRELLSVPAGNGVEIAHVEREARWAVRARTRIRASKAVKDDWGTPRANFFRLFEDLLNQRATVIHDTVVERGTERTVRNETATLAAREKAQEIATEFKRWAWADPDRVEELVRRYNELFNDVRPRDYDGSHLTFPGLSADVTPDPHQRNVAWQIVSRGNAIMAHEVGAGKTLAAILASMRLRQLGICSKPLHATLNNMLEEYTRAFLQAYPEAKLLTAHAEDVSTKAQRRLFFARAATGEYDAIIVTHSAFERLGMSADFEQKFLASEVAEFEELVECAKKEEGERSLTVKQLQVVLREYEARLAVAANRVGKDTNLTFEELGVDWLFIDEIHLFKNAATATKIVGMPRAAKPSKRSADLMMKCAYLQSLRPGHGVVGMTGTLISNTVAELHVHMRYVGPDILREFGIEHFDAFAANFIRRTWELEPTPDGGGFGMRERFHYNNVTELLGIVAQVIDIQLAESIYEPASPVGAEDSRTEEPAPALPTGDGLPEASGGTPIIRIRTRGPRRLLQLPRPKLYGGRPEILTAAPSDAHLEFTESLVARAARIRDPHEKVDPRDDNMLLVVNDGRKAALDMRLIYPGLPDHPGSKVNLLVTDVAERWAATQRDRATQLIFCDLSVPRARGFSVYEDIRQKLISLGIPPHEIAFMQQARNARQKESLHAAIRAGIIRVAIGGTVNLGTGVNVQDRIIAMHHLDAPYRPSDVEQRDGRGARRGNIWPFIWIRRYVTERSFDLYLWNLLHYKLTMINRVLMGDPSIREISDNDGVSLSYAEVKALAAGNPLILEKARAEVEIASLRRARSVFLDRQVRARADCNDMPRRLALAEDVLAASRADLERRAETAGDEFLITIAGEAYAKRADAGAALRRTIEEACHASRARETVAIGSFAGFELLAVVHPRMNTSLILRGERDYEQELQLFQSPLGLVQSLEGIPRRLDAVVVNHQQQVDHLRLQVERLHTATESEYPEERRLAALEERLTEITSSLHFDEPQPRQALGAVDIPLPAAVDEDDDVAFAA